MDNPEQHLLSKQKLIDLHYLVRISEAELAKAEPKHALISKYHERLWFQKAWQKDKNGLLQEYYDLARLIDHLTETIGEQKRAFYLHSAAVEFLHNSNMPYKNINLQQHTLSQQQLF